MTFLCLLWDWFFRDNTTVRDEFMAYFSGPTDPYAEVDEDFFLQKLSEFVKSNP